jgi:hypothetical protein
MNSDQLIHNEILEHLENQCLAKPSRPQSISFYETMEALFIMIKFSSVKFSWNAGKVLLGLIVGSMILLLLICFSFLIISVFVGYGVIRCVNKVKRKKKLRNSQLVKSGKRGMLG